MNIRYTNVIVHVSGSFDTGQRAGLEQSLPGVGRAVVSPWAERLVLVDYDPLITDSRHILETVRDRGLAAQLVGM
jgi:hypothetical protein